MHQKIAIQWIPYNFWELRPLYIAHKSLKNNLYVLGFQVNNQEKGGMMKVPLQLYASAQRNTVSVLYHHLAI